MTLEQELELYIQEYRANYTSPEAIRSLQKTFQSHNITIEDWNSLITFIDANTRTSAINDIYTFLTKLLEQVDTNTAKLDTVESGAQVNIVEGVQVDGTDLPVSNKKVNIVISGKADKVNSATDGHLAGLDSSGNLTDSGISADDVQKKVGPLPRYSVSYSDSVLSFLTQTNCKNRPIVLSVAGPGSFFASFSTPTDDLYLGELTFEIENCTSAVRYAGSISNWHSLKFLDLLSSTYQQNYENSNNKVTSLSNASTDAQYPSAKCVYDNLQLKENVANKVTELSSESTDNQYPSAKCVYDVAQNLREVAEGKCNVFVLSTTMTIANLKTAYQSVPTNVKLSIWDTSINDWKDVTTNLVAGDYDELDIVNSSFDTNNDYFNFGSNKYLLLYDNRPNAKGNHQFLVRADTYFVGISPYPWKVGDIILVTKTSVPDRWFAGSMSWNALETTKIDLNNYPTFANLNSILGGILCGNYNATSTYTLNDIVIYDNKLYKCTTAITQAEAWDSSHWTQIFAKDYFVDLCHTQTITGDKTFNGSVSVPGASFAPSYMAFQDVANFINSAKFYYQVIPSSSNAVDIGTSSLKFKDIYLSGRAYLYNASNYKWSIGVSGGGLFQINGNDDTAKYSFFNTYLIPGSNGNQDLGSTTYKWKDGYFAGQVYAQNTNNVIKVSDMTSNNTFTSNQVDIIKNGKMTIIDGNFGGNTDELILFKPQDLGAVLQGFCLISNAYAQIGIYQITVATGYCSIISETTQRINLRSIANINGKAIPAYPTTNTYPQYLTIGDNGGSMYWSDVSGFNIIDAFSISNNTLTDAQYATITNGRPTIIRGTFLGCENPILFSPTIVSGNCRGMFVGNRTNTTYTELTAYLIDESTKVIQKAPKRIEISADKINDKAFPSYPSSPTANMYLTYKTNGTLDWTEVSGGSATITAGTYAEIKALKDASQLVPGAYYRITDYTAVVSPKVSFTSSSIAKSAKHQFDLIIQAIDVNKFSTKATATLHEGDTYFANCALEDWEIEYEFDNNKNVHGWAVDTPMILCGTAFNSCTLYIRDTTSDVAGADYPYAWKESGGSAKRYTNTETPADNGTAYSSSSGGTSYTIMEAYNVGKGVIFYMKDEYDNECPYDFKNILFCAGSSSTAKYYTFSRKTNYQHADASLDGTAGNNVIKPFLWSGVYALNFVYFYVKTNQGQNSNLGAFDNEIDYDCYLITFGEDCKRNVIGKYCYGLSFADQCCDNVFGDQCHSIALKQNCCSNTFGDECIEMDGSSYSGSIGTNCKYNVFGHKAYKCKLGNYCEHNKLDGLNSWVVLGSYCKYNHFELNAGYAYFGNYCTNITLGSNAMYIYFGTSSSNVINYCTNITIGNGCKYISITSDDTTASSSNQLQNVVVHMGVSGSSDSNKITLNLPDRNQNFETSYKVTGSTEVLL